MAKLDEIQVINKFAQQYLYKTSLRVVSQKISQNGHLIAQNRPAPLWRALRMVITWPFFIQF